MRFLIGTPFAVAAGVIGFVLADLSFTVLALGSLGTVFGLGAVATILALVWPRRERQRAASAHVR